MRIQTLSILVGSEICNACCPFCVSKMTPLHGIALKEPKVNWRNFKIACKLAKQSGVATAMFTGKGEPALFPKQITEYLRILTRFEFPFIEIQTNGIAIAEESDKYLSYLKSWYDFGITTIAVSIVHYDAEKNREIYTPHKKTYIDLPGLIKVLHERGFSVRLTCILLEGFIDNPKELQHLVDFAKENRVEQLTITPINKPSDTSNQKIWQWTEEHQLTKKQLSGVIRYVGNKGTQLMRLIHGAKVYDLAGQNICLNNCLALRADSEDMRNLIFFPDGHLRYDWQYKGAILL